MEDIFNALAMFTNFVLLPAAAYGSQLALGALGVTLVYGILRFSNFAHGDTMAFGTMIAILFTWWLQSQGVSLGFLPTALLAIPVAVLVTIGFVLLSDRWVYRYHRVKKAPAVVFLICSVGVMFLLNGIVRFIIGPGEQHFTDGERFIFTVAQFRDFTGLEQGIALRTSQALTLVTAVLIVLALFWFLERSRTGKSMRAYSDNENLALLSGINPERVVLITWVLAAALATVAGVLYGLDKGFRPFTYFQLLLPIFAAAIVGGLGSPLGAIAGGFIVAFSEVLLTYAWRRVLMYLGPEGWEPEGLMQLLSTDYKFAVSFVILVLVLLIRPTGLFGGKSV
ncbi:MAG: branched-chain amino acid ABC transporter permease [Comamonadaceae bacterium BICA1-1]|nr:MAG: branched-chain amino acid ABC transporter permease [Comamonadaceae bacterium BICA1-1]